MANKVKLVIPLFESRWNSLMKLSDTECGEIAKNLIRIMRKEETVPFSDAHCEALFDIFLDDLQCFNERKEEQRERMKEHRQQKKQSELQNIVTNCDELCDIVADCAHTELNGTELNGTEHNNNTLSGKPDSKSRKNRKNPEEITRIIEYLNQKTGKKFSPHSKANREYIGERLAEGYCFDDFKAAIDNETSRWLGTDMEKYLRPTTLFSKSKFDGYVNDTFIGQEKSKWEKGMTSTEDLREYYKDLDRQEALKAFGGDIL